MRSDPTDAQLEAYEHRRAGRVLSGREADGAAADQWANYEGVKRRAHLGELAEMARLRDRLRHAEHAASLFADHLHGCVATPAEQEAVTEWEHAAGITPAPEDDTLRSEL